MVAPYKQALAAFRRDCNEMVLIASLLREKFKDALLAPILDVGAGSGELAALAFPDLPATLIDREPYEQPINPKHIRETRDFAGLDLAKLNPGTIMFCHSAYYFLHGDPESAGARLLDSGAKAVLVVSNEPEGALRYVADCLRSSGVSFQNPFHVELPRWSLKSKEPFVARLASADFKIMAKHLVRIVFDLQDSSVESLVEQQLRSRHDHPEMHLSEAVYCYGPQRC